ncbi:unnamed protein product [Caenorhabditis nigoni]
MDFDYDRSANPVPKTLMDMPVEMMLKITGYLDPVERTVLRSVNRAMKDAVDALPSVFEKLEIKLNWDNSLDWKLNNKPKTYSEYEKLEKLVNIPGFQVNQLRLINRPIQSSLTDRWNISLNPKSVDITAETTNQMIELLSIAKPGDLQSIRLVLLGSHETNNFPTIFTTEQFKQAKHVDIVSFVFDYNIFLAKFVHLNSFKLRTLAPVRDEMICTLRQIISIYYKSFEKCEISFVDFEDRFRVRSFGEALGEEIPFGPLKTITHRYRIPESNEYLEVEIKDEGCYCCVKIVKTR